MFNFFYSRKSEPVTKEFISTLNSDTVKIPTREVNVFAGSSIEELKDNTECIVLDAVELFDKLTPQFDRYLSEDMTPEVECEITGKASRIIPVFLDITLNNYNSVILKFKYKVVGSKVRYSCNVAENNSKDVYPSITDLNTEAPVSAKTGDTWFRYENNTMTLERFYIGNTEYTNTSLLKGPLRLRGIIHLVK